MNRTNLKDRIYKTMDQISDGITITMNIAATGLSVALQIFLCVVVLVAIYKSPRLGYIELFGMVGGALLAAFVSWKVTSVFIDDEKIKLHPVFWIMAFLVGSGMLAQYAETPDAVITLQTVFTLAWMIALPAWFFHLTDRVVGWLNPLNKEEKEKRAEKKTSPLQTDELSAATQRLADDESKADKSPPQTDQADRVMWYEY